MVGADAFLRWVAEGVRLECAVVSPHRNDLVVPEPLGRGHVSIEDNVVEVALARLALSGVERLLLGRRQAGVPAIPPGAQENDVTRLELHALLRRRRLDQLRADVEAFVGIGRLVVVVEVARDVDQDAAAHEPVLRPLVDADLVGPGEVFVLPPAVVSELAVAMMAEPIEVCPAAVERPVVNVVGSGRPPDVEVVLEHQLVGTPGGWDGLGGFDVDHAPFAHQRCGVLDPLGCEEVHHSDFVAPPPDVPRVVLPGLFEDRQLGKLRQLHHVNLDSSSYRFGRRCALPSRANAKPVVLTPTPN